MSHHDADICEVVVVLKALEGELFIKAVERLKTAGLEVISVGVDEAIVQGSIDARKMGEINQFEFVQTIRTIMTYVADYPAGDPRDLDGADDDEAAEA